MQQRAARVAGDDAEDTVAAALPERAARVVDERRFGPDRMTVYALREVPCSPD
jgi:hypothetical protein